MFLREFLTIAALFSFANGRCTLELEPAHGSVACTDEDHTRVCALRCEEDYFPQGASETRCHRHRGAWSRDLGVCIKCPTMKESAYSRVSRTEHMNGDVTFHFTCANWTELIGPEEVTCSARTGRWSHGLPPLCQPDFSKCGEKDKPRCPVISKKLTREFAPYKALLSREEKELIATIVKNLRVAPLLRSSANRSCFSDMCKIKCVHLPRKWANKCKFCKKRKTIICGRKASLFGR